MEQDRIETVLSVVDNYTREIERYRNELKTVTKQITDMGNTSGGAVSGVRKLAASLGGIKGILAGLGIAVGIKEIGKLGMSCIDAASEIKELDNVLEQVFEKGSNEVVKWADSISTNVGRASFELQKQASIFGAVFKGAGIKTEDLQDMSMALSQLAADFSSFYDNDMEQVFNALKSGLTGETEPLKRYGIILNETTAAEYALSMGIKTKWKEMSEAQKQIVRYNFLMEKTKFVQGDAERTIDSYANQVKVLNAYWDSISRTLGQKFIPVGEDTLHIINNLMGTIDGWLNKPTAGGYIGEFLGEASEIQNLAAEYEALSKKASLTNDEESRRVQIFSELQTKYPDILSGISGEKSAYRDVITALDDVIERLKEKIKLQIMEGFSDEMAKEVKKFTDKINKAMETANNIKVKIATDFNIDADKFVTPQMVEELKKSMDKGMAERMAATGKMTAEFEDMLVQQGVNDKNAIYIARMLTDYAANQVEVMQKQEQGYVKLEDNLTKIAQKRDNTIEIFDKFASSIEAGDNQILQGIFSVKQDIKNNANNIISNSKIAQLESDKYIAGVVRDSKGEVVGRIDGSEKALSMEMLQGFLETNDHITIMGSELHTTISKGLNGMYNIVQRSAQNGVVVNETDKNAENLEKAIRGLSKNINKPNLGDYNKASGGSSKNKGGKGKSPEKDKWEQMLESLNKQIKDFSINSEVLAGKIKNARNELDKLEISKIIDFRDALDWSNAEVLQSFIKIKETSRDLARTLGDKGAVEQYTQEIKKLNEQLYFANTSKDYKKKTEELNYNIKKDDNKQVYNELIKNMAEYFEASSIDLEKRYTEGMDDYDIYLDKQIKLLEGIEDTFDKLGLTNKKLAAVMEKEALIREKNQNNVIDQIKEIRAMGELLGTDQSEVDKQIADVYKNSSETIAKSIYELTKRIEQLKKNTPQSTEVKEEKTENSVKNIEKSDKSTEELQKELIFINSEIVKNQKVLSELNSHLSILPENLRSKQEEEFKRNIDLWQKLLDNAYAKKEQLEYSLGTPAVVASTKKDGEITGLLTTEDKKILEDFNIKLGEKLKYITHGINIDFSVFNTIDDIKAMYDETQKQLSELSGKKDNAVNKSKKETYTVLLQSLSEILKTNTGREIVNKGTQKTVKAKDIGELERLKAEETEKLVQALKNEREQREIARQSSQVYDFEKGIEDLFLNINPQGIQESLISGVKDLFDKAVTGTDIGGVYRDKYNVAFGNTFKEVMADFKPSGNYLKDQEEYQKRFIGALKELATSSDAAVRSIANLTLFDTVKGQLDELAGHLTTAGEVLKDDFLKNLAITVESLASLAESLKNTSLTSNSKLGGILGGVGGFLSNVTSGIGMVTGLVTTGVSLFRSAGNLLGFGSSKKQKAKNEEERKKAAEWYEKQFKENADLIKSINDLTGSIVDLNTKLIQNIANDTSDKNITKQKNYYDNLITKTGDLFDENITATGYSTSKKRRLFGSKTKDSYGTLNQSFDEYFGDAWKYTARDSKSLEQFYDAYLKNFDINTLKKKLGKNSLDNQNIDEVKGQFLRFIDDIKTMERHSANLPKNGILESFEGVEVVDVFELRDEYQKQLENIYKGMGKDPENHREEILNQVNVLIQEGQTIISAFNDVKSTFYGKIIEGDQTIMSLATGMESYFTKLRTNISKVFYDINFQGLEEGFNSKFANISDKLADLRLSGNTDLNAFVNENLNFWNEFTMLKSTENIKNDMNEVLNILKSQAKGAGLSDDVINAMFPDSAIEDKASDIKNALEKAMRDALDTNSFSQFSMSLGDSIYNSVKDGLIEAFYESNTFKALAEKYFLNEDYTKALEGAGSFKDAYDIIKAQLDKAEIQLQAEGLDFRGTNSSTGEYYGGLSNSYKTATGLLASEMKFDFTINNYGFLAIDDLMKHITKTVKEELHKSSKKEV
ncbi:Uncharacterised protein [Sebaldella termitidis]|uniref:Uncharacterized protein n=1 Tax=Sebaldella termitidis (strain ATCC 33386 / NCTC 11300) TaxID=526218 RepID=D1AHA2_SEBTE|nr:hypothetical protein [Sebaldella termitidis]ACZ08136.1 hypothetical protein Sterm_1269 [Sebaldella termitidis ATCC 33386]SUI23438.1 Uncharacterised protein [Sebaldella termitidis]